MTGGQDRDVIIPMALTDFAKALRELIGAFRDILGLAKDGRMLIRRRIAELRSGDLDNLGFAPDGMVNILRRIAEDKSTSQDFALLGQLIGNTADDVEHSVHALRKYRKEIRINCGAEAVNRFDDLLDGPNGKFVIRHEIGNLIQLHERNVKKSELQKKVTEVLELIDKFNAALISLHDQILPPRGAPV